MKVDKSHRKFRRKSQISLKNFSFKNYLHDCMLCQTASWNACTLQSQNLQNISLTRRWSYIMRIKSLPVQISDGHLNTLAFWLSGQWRTQCTMYSNGHSLSGTARSFDSRLGRLKFLFSTTRFFLVLEGSSSPSLSLSLLSSCSWAPFSLSGSSLGASGYTLRPK